MVSCGIRLDAATQLSNLIRQSWKRVSLWYLHGSHTLLLLTRLSAIVFKVEDLMSFNVWIWECSNVIMSHWPLSRGQPSIPTPLRILQGKAGNRSLQRMSGVEEWDAQWITEASLHSSGDGPWCNAPCLFLMMRLTPKCMVYMQVTD